MVKKQGRTHTFRGYIAKRDDDRYVAVFLRPNLVAEGRTAGEANHRLMELLQAYLTEAASDGQVEHYMSLRAPLRFYAEYLVARLFHAINHALKPISKTCCVPQHA